MKSRLVSRVAVVAYDACAASEPAKRALGTAPSCRDAATGDEERRTRCRVIPSPRGGMGNQETSQIWPNGYQSRLIEFALTNVEDGGG